MSPGNPGNDNGKPPTPFEICKELAIQCFGDCEANRGACPTADEIVECKEKGSAAFKSCMESMKAGFSGLNPPDCR
jgi:hypothetical protein